jgi:cold shock CspA family protein
MFEELSKHINKQVSLLLKNGKEKTGRIVFLDSDDQTVTFEDESTLALSFIKSMNGNKAEQTLPVVEVKPEPTIVQPVEVKAEPEVKAETEIKQEPVIKTEAEVKPLPKILLPQTPPEVIAKVQQLKEQYKTRIAEATLFLPAPELNGMPNEIKDIDGIGKSEEAKMWTNILNQYNDGVRLGKFATDIEKVEKTLVHVRHLSQSPFLYAFVAIPQLLAYLTYMQGEKKEAIEHIKHAIRIQDSPENAIGLATIALELGENELAFFTLKKLFLKVNFTEEKYKTVWSKFLELVIKIGAYNDFSMIFSGKYRQFSPEEKEGVMEAVVYFLLQNRQRKDAEDLVWATLQSASDVRYLALDALKKWGQPDREYEPEDRLEEYEEAGDKLPKKEIINLPPSTRQFKPKPQINPIPQAESVATSPYVFSSTILTLRENFGFIKYGTNNLFFHAFDLVNCSFMELSVGDQVEFKLKKGVKGSDVACEVRLMHAPRKIIPTNPIVEKFEPMSELIENKEE